MALVNHAKREINAKIVCCGPSGAGKGSLIKAICSRLPAEPVVSCEACRSSRTGCCSSISPTPRGGLRQVLAPPASLYPHRGYHPGECLENGPQGG